MSQQMIFKRQSCLVLSFLKFTINLYNIYTHACYIDTFHDIFHSLSELGYRVLTYKRQKNSPAAVQHSEHPNGSGRYLNTTASAARCPQDTAETPLSTRHYGNSRLIIWRETSRWMLARMKQEQVPKTRFHHIQKHTYTEH